MQTRVFCPIQVYKKSMAAISTRMPPVAVEYDNRGQRVSRIFDDAYAARQFYVAKFKAGERPKVLAIASPVLKQEKSMKAKNSKTTSKKTGTKKKPLPQLEVALQKVRPSKTDSYYTGVILKRHGLKTGVTEQMVKEYDQLRGKNRPDGAWANLTWAWHVVNGFVGEIAVDNKTADA